MLNFPLANCVLPGNRTKELDGQESQGHTANENWVFKFPLSWVSLSLQLSGVDTRVGIRARVELLHVLEIGPVWLFEIGEIHQLQAEENYWANQQ
jgi:hypothetical protein